MEKIYSDTAGLMLMIERNQKVSFWNMPLVIDLYIQPSAPDHTHLSDASTIKELISLHFSRDSLSAKVTSIDSAFSHESD